MEKEFLERILRSIEEIIKLVRKEVRKLKRDDEEQHLKGQV